MLLLLSQHDTCVTKKFSPVGLLCFCGLVPFQLKAGGDFEEAFLRKNKNGATPDVFVYQNAITPGLKTVDITINNRATEQLEIHFIKDEGNRVIPCLSREQLKSFGIKVDLYSGWEEESTNSDGMQCEDLVKRIPAAHQHYEDAQQVLHITVPQEALETQHFTMIPEKEWDHGITSLRTSYSGYFYSSKTKGYKSNGWKTDDTTQNSTYVNLNTVGSLGAWRFYSIDTFYRNPGKSWESNHDRMYISRDFASLRSNFQAGEIYTKTSGYMMGSLPLSGVSLATNDRMLMDNQFSYAPVIRGVARTNARLVVRQRSNIIYSTTLTPGPFAIDDIYSAQIGADLDVMVEESDGQVQSFRVPYTALPNMIRPGVTRYSTAAGKYRTQGRSTDEPWITTASLERGFEHYTLNSSLQIAKDYQSISGGIAWNIGSIGAFSTEIAHTRHRDTWNNDRQSEGSAARFLFARQFDSTGTSLQILGYQYRSKNFLDFQEFISKSQYQNIDGYRRSDSEWDRRKRNRFEMTLNQNMEGFGSLYLSMSQDRYYGSHSNSYSISGGMGTTVGRASIALALTKTQDNTNDTNMVNLSVSMPLGRADRNLGSLSYNLNRDNNNQYSQSFGYSDTVLDNRVNFSANLQRDAHGKYSQSGSVGYNGSLANVSAGVGRSNGYQQYSAGMSGGVTMYSGGVILSPVLGKTIGIVETQGASGIGVSGTNNAKTDYFGHAVVTWLTPYRYNTINLDTASAGNVELKDSSRRVVPSEGAAVHLKFATRVGRRALIDIRSQKTIPLGAMVYLEGEDEEAGIVGNNGIAYLSGLDARANQNLTVVWGKGKAHQCQFVLPAAPETANNPDSWHKKQAVACH